METEAGLDQSPQGEPVRWCPHRPLPPHGDVDPVPIHIGRVLPANIITWPTCWRATQLTNRGSAKFRPALLRVQPGRRRGACASLAWIVQLRQQENTCVRVCVCASVRVRVRGARQSRRSSLIFAFREGVDDT